MSRAKTKSFWDKHIKMFQESGMSCSSAGSRTWGWQDAYTEDTSFYTHTQNKHHPKMGFILTTMAFLHGVSYAFEYNNFFRNKGYDSEVVNNTRVSMITEWETFTDVTARKLYYRTYDNPDIKMVDLKNSILQKGRFCAIQWRNL